MGGLGVRVWYYGRRCLVVRVFDSRFSEVDEAQEKILVGSTSAGGS